MIVPLPSLKIDSKPSLQRSLHGMTPSYHGALQKLRWLGRPRIQSKYGVRITYAVYRRRNTYNTTTEYNTTRSSVSHTLYCVAAVDGLQPPGPTSKRYGVFTNHWPVKTPPNTSPPTPAPALVPMPSTEYSVCKAMTDYTKIPLGLTGAVSFYKYISAAPRPRRIA